MPDDRTVLDHLLEGRDALQHEVARLTAAIEQLDSVLGRLGGLGSGSDGSANTSTTGQPALAEAAPEAPEPAPSTPEPVNPPAEVEAAPEPTVTAPPVRKAPARKAPARRAASGGAAVRSTTRTAARTAPARTRGREARPAEPPKSIRVHVLEMLGAENRDFGLAEIIDRIHDAGIQAHDDAVRSITIKLMKDGSVERVGRGQYRLARRGAAGAASEPAEAPAPAADEPTTYPTYAAPEATSESASEPESADTAVAPAQDVTDRTNGADGTDRTPDENQPAPAYTPSLNLGQPWNS